MQLQLRTAIQSSGNKSEKREKREQLKAKKCEKKGERGKKAGEGRAGATGKRTIDIYTRRLERKRRRKNAA